MQEKISLAGDLGSGKSTVSDLLLERLGAEYYSTGSIVRDIAKKRGMSVVELNVYMETHPEIDREIDDGLIALSEDERFLIIDSRMAWHFTKGTFKVYLSCDLEVSAARIMNANRTGEHSATLEDTVADTRARRESEKKRYMEQYGVDIKDLSNYSLVLDTTYATPEQVADALIFAFDEWRADRSYACAMLAPERLNYADDVAEVPEVERRAAMLDRGEEIPEVTVFEEDGEFFVLDGAESVLAYAINMETYVPARLVAKPLGLADIKYVRMKNSL